MRHPTDNRKAFTLVELALVIVIMALLAALAYPAIRNSWASFSGRSGTDDFIRLLRQTRLYATQMQLPCEIRFIKTDEGEYKTQVFVFDTGGHSKQLNVAWTQTATDVPIKLVEIAATATADPQPVKFYPTGVKQTVLLTLNPENDDERVVKISAPSGIISFGTVDSMAGTTFASEAEKIKKIWQEQCLKTVSQ
ncbi:MAG TPA: prepilin-type N-terminal cleavage/methylation domain-containing protein [Phycisphaerae bacterium]|mgnify:CR=1 FL=1|nr:prepilin-type N-terminal cleavage/methylation domain-containing protein [Phycisphaerae bacterium]HPS52644.1 prepilin-type N-terminal cleavage/methylation domain-containing protein [Phycisphaerae bacterium]